MKRNVLVALLAVSFIGLSASPVLGADVQTNIPKSKEFRIERSMSPQAMACIECHKKQHPGIFSDWASSRHASANITCYDCHAAESHDPDVSQSHYKEYNTKYGQKEYMVPVSAVVTPKDCSRCHPDEAMQYSNSKHANTLEIIWKTDPWLNNGMNSDFERVNGCFHCHGTIVKMTNNELEPATCPNVGCRNSDDFPRCHGKNILGTSGPADGPAVRFCSVSCQNQLERGKGENAGGLHAVPREEMD